VPASAAPTSATAYLLRVQTKDSVVADEPPAQSNPPQKEPSWLEDSRRLIPGEALAGYISLEAISATAVNPLNINIVLGIVFLVVTILLRWIGTQDPEADAPALTAQWGVVLISALSFVFLVYATGGQIWWHQPVVDQKLYGQIFAAALGILGPNLYRGTLLRR
jgi:hypothetical protein